MDTMLRKALWEVLKPLVQLITNLVNPDIGEMWLVELKKFLRKEPCWMGGEAVRKGVTKVLRHLNIITVPLASQSELEEFTFETREGLWVGDAFASIFGTKVSAEGTSIALGEHQLIKDASDSAITAELPPGYVFKGEAGKEKLKHIIASLILAQWGGTEGTLRNTGYANIFYVELEDGPRLAVHVYWYSFDREWHVDVWEFDDVRWGAELVVFSCN